MDKIFKLALNQIEEGKEAREERLKIIKKIEDYYNNQTVTLEGQMITIDFPLMSQQVKKFLAQIDEPPQVEFKIPNRKELTEKLKTAFEMEKKSMRNKWLQKDRAEKRNALISGRGICKLYSTSINNKFRFHYELIDYHNFIADPKHGDLDEGLYHGVEGIKRSKEYLVTMAKAGIYDKRAVAQVITKIGEEEEVELTEWILKHKEKLWYILYWNDIILRKDLVKNITGLTKSPYVSWAVDYDEFKFWTKGVGDDILPMAKAISTLLSLAIENELRRTRPQKIIEAGAFPDLTELQEYTPDGIIVSNPSRKPEVITLSSPTATTTLNIVDFLNEYSRKATGLTTEAKSSTKVGVYYGQLAEQSDLIGLINKNYSQSYAEKGYRYFWALRKDLTEPIAVDMLGKGGIKLMELTRFDLKDIDDVDDIQVTGGAREQELNLVEAERQSKAVSSLVGAYGEKINPEWVIKTTLRREGFSDDDIRQALETGAYNQDILNEADEAIQQILLGRTPKLNNGATIEFIQRIHDYAVNNLDYVKLDKNGNVIGIDKKKKQQFMDLMSYARAHREIAIRNIRRKVDLQAQQINLPVNEYTRNDMISMAAKPNESPIKPQAIDYVAKKASDTSKMSNEVSNILTPEYE